MTDDLSAEQAEQADQALAAIREALRQPVSLSMQEEQAFHEFRSRSFIRRHTTIRKIRRGKLVFRRGGVAGADLAVHPIQWDLFRAHKRFDAQQAFLIPPTPPDSALGVAARQQKAASRRAPVLAALKFYAGRGRKRVALVVRQTGESSHYVRRVLRESVRDPE
jgi:hypothetical protein